jgi:hypothetical protein
MSRALGRAALIALVAAACGGASGALDAGGADGEADAAPDVASVEALPPPGGTGVGDACLFDSECPTGTYCELFCSRACAADGDCAGNYAGGRNGQGQENRCVQIRDELTGKTWLACFPGCNGTTDCFSGLECQPGPTAAGGTTMVCAAPP